MAKKVIVYTTSYCPYCNRAKETLKKAGIAFQEIDVTNDDKLRDELEKKTGGWQTVPMIFIGDEFIGGADDLTALAQSGKLKTKVK